MWGIEWSLNRVLNLVVPPLGLLLLLAWAPVLFALNYAVRLVRSFFSVNAARDKAVLITGASSGIGEHIAYEFARRGARLVLCARREGRLREVARRCGNMGAADVRIVEGDVSKEDDCRRMVDAAITNFRSLDYLVCNAGIGHAFLFKDAQSIEAMRQVMDVDFFGSMWITLHALPFLRRARGQILVNASIGAFLPMPRFSIYNASKAGLTQFFDTLRAEPVGADVGITIGFPGATASELAAGKVLDEQGRMVVDQDRRDALLGPQPMLRTDTVAKALVDGACCGARYVLIPTWFSAALLFRLFAPEALAQLVLADDDAASHERSYPNR
ncbi:unnamed protein product [Closterium sp. Yama58-4]|nr:unnamed protein product [Closterium sp. Yama58-4]